MELEGKLKVSFGYDVTEETNVYIYAGTPSSQTNGMRKVGDDNDNALKIYGIEIVRRGPSGIDAVTLDGEPYAGVVEPSEGGPNRTDVALTAIPENTTGRPRTFCVTLALTEYPDVTLVLTVRQDA